MKFLLRNKKNILSIYSILILILINLINLPYSLNSTLEEVHKAIKEVAYSFYMRGKYIQFSDSKYTVFHPEDATQQKIQFVVCWNLVQSIYTELLNITVPLGDWKNFQYSVQYLGSPEVIAYSKINTQTNNLEMSFYNSSSKNNITTKINPSINDIIPLLKIGDILSYSLHTFLIYDVIKDSKGNVIDAIVMESGYGSGRA